MHTRFQINKQRCQKKSPNRWLSKILLILSIGFSPAVLAETNPPQTEESTLSFELELDSIHQNLNWAAERLDVVAFRVDDYFAPEQQVDRKHSVVLLSWQNQYAEHDGYEMLVKLSAKMQLPKLKEKLELFVEAATRPDEEEVQAQPRITATDNDQSLVGLGLLYTLNRHIKFKNRAGLRFTESQLDPYVTTGFVISKALSDATQVVLEPELFWRRVEGRGQQTTLTLRHRYDSRNLLLSTSNGIKFDNLPQWDFIQRLQWAHKWDNDNIITTETARLWRYEHSMGLEDTYFQVGWRHKWYQNWLYITLTPGVHYPQRLDYQSNPYFMITFDAYSRH